MSGLIQNQYRVVYLGLFWCLRYTQEGYFPEAHWSFSNKMKLFDPSVGSSQNLDLDFGVGIPYPIGTFDFKDFSVIRPLLKSDDEAP